MKPITEWPPIMTIDDVQTILEIPKMDACLMFKRPDFPLLIPGKRRYMSVSRRDLMNFLGIYE